MIAFSKFEHFSCSRKEAFGGSDLYIFPYATKGERIKNISVNFDVSGETSV